MTPLVLLLLLLAPEGSAFRFPIDPGVKREIDLGEVQRGVRGDGDPRDVIRSIREPRAVPAVEARWLGDDERVLGVEIGGEARAYPLRLLEVHELVNDTVGGRPIAPNY